MQEARLVAFAVAVSLLCGAPARAERLDEILSEMGKAGKRLKTMTADFVQTDHDFLLKDQEETRGKLFLAVPGRIRWEHAPPREKVLLVKDDLVRVYNPTAGQLHEFERGKGSSSGGTDLLIGFGSGNEKIRESYDVSLVEETAAAATILLVPKPGKASLFTKIELTLDNKTWTRCDRCSIRQTRTGGYSVLEHRPEQGPSALDVRAETSSNGNHPELKSLGRWRLPVPQPPW
jgi:outer membrane lipoprotein-sorting protein